jgi:hypothetical protein
MPQMRASRPTLVLAFVLAAGTADAKRKPLPSPATSGIQHVVVVMMACPETTGSESAFEDLAAQLLLR